jgi:hypothetical protein
MELSCHVGCCLPPHTQCLMWLTRTEAVVSVSRGGSTQEPRFYCGRDSVGMCIVVILWITVQCVHP